MKNVHRIKVALGETDAAGIVFYPNFYRWMDQASHELMGAYVSPVSKLQKEKNIILPLLETFCQFKSPLFFEDIVEVHSKVIEINKKVLKVEHFFQRAGEIVASGYEVRAWTSTEGGKLKAVPVPDDVCAALGHETVKQ